MGSIGDEFEKRIKNPHDAVVKAAFRKKALARSFFRKYLPGRILDLIDLDSLDIRDGSYVDEKLRDKHSDIVYKTKIRGSDAFLYLLFEHQSSPDRFFVFRLICYMVNLWKEHVDQNPKAPELPVVIPLVLYHGKERWNPPDRLWKLLERGENFRDYVPDFVYRLYDLSEYEDDSLLVGDFMALGVVLYLMKHIFDEKFGDIFVRALECLKTVRDKKVQLEFLELALRYAYHARNDEEAVAREYIEKGVERIDDQRARRLAMTVAEQIRQRGLEEGIEKGKKDTFLKIAERRFGRIHPLLEKKIRDSDLATIEDFGEALFDLRGMEDLERWWADR